MIRAVATRLTISEVPPNEMNGSGTPVTGHDDVTTPMLMNAWMTISSAQPTIEEKAEAVGARAARA